MTAASPRIAAVVLAAGRSSRMGHFKLLAEIAGRPMLRHVVDAALASSARPVVVVTGNEADRVAQALQDLDVHLVHNQDFAAGLSTSLKAGIGALSPDIDAAIILLGDMPRIAGTHIAALIGAFAPGAIVVPVRQGQRGNPVLWPRDFFPQLLSLSGDQGARRLLVDLAARVREVEMPDDAIFQDIDTPEALALLQAQAPKTPRG